MSTPRSPEPRRWLVLALLCGAAFGACAASVEELKAQRAQIDVARRQANVAYAEREKRCHEQFVVTACVENARAERRRELDRLSREQSVVDEALRKQRAAERLQMLADKQRAARQRASEPLPPPRVLLKPSRASQPASATSAPAARGERLGVVPQDRSTPAERRDNKAAFERRQQQAEEHRRLVEQRNAERAVRASKPASALPTPAASELPR